MLIDLVSMQSKPLSQSKAVFFITCENCGEEKTIVLESREDWERFSFYDPKSDKCGFCEGEKK